VAKRLARGDPHTIRFRVPDKTVFLDDFIRGRVRWDANRVLGDFVIIRSNGMPVYNFCVAIDDMLMKISHVVRGDEHLSNTLRQLLILEALGSRPLCTPTAL
jgi:glutamyl/glutaminyl-tRNA synthetase